MLIGYSSARPDGTQVAAYAAAHTERLHFLVAHRPGFVLPTVAARSFATLDQFTEGRIALHTITGGNDAEQRRDGDYLSKDERYARTDEYLDILERAWTSDEAFSFERPATTASRTSRRGPPVPAAADSDLFRWLFGGGLPGRRRHADVYALWGEPLAETAAQIASVGSRQSGASTPGSASRSTDPWTAESSPGNEPTASWPRQGQRQEIQAELAPQSGARAARSPRTLAHSDCWPRRPGERHDRALWTPLAAATGAAGNSTALVGTPETVAQALLDYVDIGVTTLLIRGYDPYDDAIDYGRHLLPLVREEIARRRPGAGGGRGRRAAASGGAGNHPV